MSLAEAVELMSCHTVKLSDKQISLKQYVDRMNILKCLEMVVDIAEKKSEREGE